MKYLLEEWSLKGGTLTQLEDSLLYLGKKEVIPGMLYMTVNFSCDLSVEQDIISSSFYYQIYTLYKRKRVLLLTLVNRFLPNPMINQVTYILYIIVIYKPVFSKGDTKKYIAIYVPITLYSVIINYFHLEYNSCFYYFIM